MSDFTRYYVAGAIATTVINYGVFLTCYSLMHLWYLAAATISFSIRSMAKFAYLSVWMDRIGATVSVARRATLFLGSELGTLAAGNSLLFVLVEHFSFSPPLALALIICCFFLVSLSLSERIFNRIPSSIV